MEYSILGPLEVRADGRAVALGGVKPRALLAVLVLHADEAVSAERLALALWGEDAPAGGIKTVHVHVSRLRKALGDPAVLATTPAGYRLRVRAGELDAERFEQLVAAGRRALAAGHPERAAVVLREALGLWRGPPLAELASEPFAPAVIARLEEQRLAALEARIDADLAVGRHAELVAELQQLIAEQPWRERLHAQLALALYRSGRQADALEAYRCARVALVEQLGIEPGAELRSLQRAILAHDPGLDPPHTTVSSAIGGPGTLPAPPTALFGREADLDGLAALIRELRTRLVTLIGPGGVGKTRLAIEAARRLAQDFTDGARFVSLASVAEPRDLASAIGRALEAPVTDAEPTASALRSFLGDRHLLLVLDNFEHLAAGAPLVAELLGACPDLTFLVTSREPTRLAAERLYPVHPLAVPDTSAPASPSTLECHSAVAMFLDRAQARDPEFVLDEANAHHVATICRRLDGLPLALELAAARVGLLAPAELAARLDRALATLAGGVRDAPERQRTLRATIDWSIGLLTDSERRAFTHLAAFAGGATVMAAESVTGASLDTLDSLVTKQLVVRRGDRLLMLETVREYARELLTQDPNRDAVQHRLAAWGLAFLREATPHLVQADRARWMTTLDAELPNLLAALSWALESRRVEAALQLVGELGEYWCQQHGWEDGLVWITASLELASDEFPRLRAKALLNRARLSGVRRQDQQYHNDLHSSLELFRACDDPGGIAACLGYLAATEWWIGHDQKARAFAGEAIRLARSAHDEGHLAQALTDSAVAAPRYADASRQARAAVAALRRVGNLLDVARVCNIVGGRAIAEGRYEAALPWLDESLDAGRQLGSPQALFFIRCTQGLAQLFLDDVEEAAQGFCDALAVCQAAACEDLIEEPLLGLAAVAVRRGDLARAARLSAAAKAHEAHGHSLDENTVRARLNDEFLTQARERYGPQNWDRTVRQGASLTVQESIDLALAHEQFSPSAAITVPPSSSYLDGLYWLTPADPEARGGQAHPRPARDP